MFYKIPEIEYVRVSELDEALRLLSRKEDVKVLAGGTDLVVDLKIGRYKPKTIVDISGIKSLRYIVDEGDKVRIGALTRMQDIVESPVIREKLPVLAEAASMLGSWQIRNMATVGGNLCNASPAADSAPPLLVHEAKIKLTSIEGTREIPITEFFTGPGTTVMKPYELLHEIIIPRKRGKSSFIKVSRVAMDLAIASAATYVEVEDNMIKDVKIALGSVAPRPVRAKRCEAALIGRRVDEEILREAASLVVGEISPIDDVRGSAWYRREVSKVLVYDSLIKSLERVRR
ncbi:MAG: xanthine dehydrogenase family protein subunit M [Zestosphaera sp.]